MLHAGLGIPATTPPQTVSSLSSLSSLTSVGSSSSLSVSSPSSPSGANSPSSLSLSHEAVIDDDEEEDSFDPSQVNLIQFD